MLLFLFSYQPNALTHPLSSLRSIQILADYLSFPFFLTSITQLVVKRHRRMRSFERLKHLTRAGVLFGIVHTYRIFTTSSSVRVSRLHASANHRDHKRGRSIPMRCFLARLSACSSRVRRVFSKWVRGVLFGFRERFFTFFSSRDLGRGSAISCGEEGAFKMYLILILTRENYGDTAACIQVQASKNDALRYECCRRMHMSYPDAQGEAVGTA